MARPKKIENLFRPSKKNEKFFEMDHQVPNKTHDIPQALSTREGTIQHTPTADKDIVNKKYLTDNYATGAHLALGETSTTAYRGDRGKLAYDHIHNLTTDIDHDALTNFAANEHFTEASIDHSAITNLTWSTSGHTMNTDLDMVDNDILNCAKIEGGDAATDNLSLSSTSNATKGYIHNADPIVIGDATAASSDARDLFQVYKEGSHASFFMHAGGSNATNNPRIYWRRFRGTLASKTACEDNDLIGQFTFQAWNGTAWRAAAQLKVVVDDTVATDYMPLAFQFFTGTNHTPPVRLTISSAGIIKVADTATILTLSRMTTTARDDFTAAEGMICYNTTTEAINVYIDGAWEELATV